MFVHMFNYTIKKKQKNGFSAIIKTNKFKRCFFMKKKIIDPIYHSIELDSYASLIINTTAFNRLNYIKQMGNTFKHYPSAVHTRFSHCLGVYHLACLLLARNDFKQYLTLHQIDTIKCAGLLHDIAHGPHSHDFE